MELFNYINYDIFHFNYHKTHTIKINLLYTLLKSNWIIVMKKKEIRQTQVTAVNSTYKCQKLPE